MKFYISFGQSHAHAIDGFTYDKDSLMLVEAPGELVARLGVNKLLAGKWSSLYHEPDLSDVLHHFSRGVVNTERPVEVFIEDYKTVEGRLIRKCDGHHGGSPCADPECWNQ